MSKGYFKNMWLRNPFFQGAVVKAHHDEKTERSFNIFWKKKISHGIALLKASFWLKNNIKKKKKIPVKTRPNLKEMGDLWILRLSPHIFWDSLICWIKCWKQQIYSKRWDPCDLPSFVYISEQTSVNSSFIFFDFQATLIQCVKIEEKKLDMEYLVGKCIFTYIYNWGLKTVRMQKCLNVILLRSHSTLLQTLTTSHSSLEIFCRKKAFLHFPVLTLSSLKIFVSWG